METKEKKAAHSYTPWITMPISVCRIAADDGNGNLKMVAHAESPEDAAYIVRAVNNHEELVALVKRYQVATVGQLKTLDLDARALLAKIKG